MDYKYHEKDTMKTPYVSVVMTSYNRGHYIGQAIDCILAQECNFPFEIIIGDDCSTDNSRELLQSYKDKYPDVLGVDAGGIALIGLCHDICKANCYTVEMRNVKDEKGNWVKEPYYKYNPIYELGHGNKSVFIVQNFIPLSLNEMSAINFHMGACGEPGSLGKDMTALKAMEDMEIVTWTVLAHNLATFIDEKREIKK